MQIYICSIQNVILMFRSRQKCAYNLMVWKLIPKPADYEHSCIHKTNTTITYHTNALLIVSISVLSKPIME